MIMHIIISFILCKYTTLDKMGKSGPESQNVHFET